MLKLGVCDDDAPAAEAGDDAAERARLGLLAEYRICRTPPEAAFDEITALAADWLDTPIAFLTITEAASHWFKSRVGIELEEVPRSVSFCDHAAREMAVMIVPDAMADARFAASPMVTGPYQIRFYAGAALRTPEGHVLGTLAVADRVRRQIAEKQKQALERLARIAMDRLELRRAHGKVQEAARIAETAHRESEARRDELIEVLECLPQAVVLVDSDDRLVLWNGNYEKMLAGPAVQLKPGATTADIVRQWLEGEVLKGRANQEQSEIWLREFLRLLACSSSFEMRNVGGKRWFRYDQRSIANGRKVYVRTEITDERNAAESFRLLFDNNPVPMWVVDKATHRYIDVNSAALAHYGYIRERFLEMTLLDIRPPREYQRILDDARNNFGIDAGREDWIHLKADGSEILVRTYANPIRYKGKDAAVVAIIDVTEQRAQEARIQHLVEHDPLTDLPNRRLFQSLLGGALARLKDNQNSAAIILTDIDNFKSVNDTLGHQVGDELIVGVASRMEACIGDRGVVARLGGDEFAILLAPIPDAAAAHDIASELIGAFASPLVAAGHRLQTSISAGISIATGAGDDPSDLLKNADLALYKAKADGKRQWASYEPQMSLHTVLRRDMELDRRRAIENSELGVEYQPMVSRSARSRSIASS